MLSEVDLLQIQLNEYDLEIHTRLNKMSNSWKCILEQSPEVKRTACWAQRQDCIKPHICGGVQKKICHIACSQKNVASVIHNERRLEQPGLFLELDSWTNWVKKVKVKVSFIVNSATCTVHTYRELKLRYSLTPWCIQITLNTNSRTHKYR